MKNILLLLLLFTGIVNGQIVNIPDANFKATLINSNTLNYIAYDENNNPIALDVNGDSEIQISEALLAYRLEVSSNISDLTGVESFTNLKYLNCSGNNLTTLNLSSLTNLIEISCAENNLVNMSFPVLPNLTTLYIFGNQLTNLDVTNLTNLELLNCFNNDLTTLNVSNLNNLTSLHFGSNQISSIDVSNLINLNSLQCSNNILTSLNISNLINLVDFACSVNLISTIDLSPLTNLTSLSCEYNLLTNLDVGNLINLNYLFCGNNLISELDVSNSPYLIKLFANGNQLNTLDLTSQINLSELACSDSNLLESIFIKNGSNDFISFYNCPNLIYICADEMQLDFIQSQFITNGLANATVNSYCSFIPAGDYNTITGKLFFDFDNNGCDVNDFTYPYIKMKMSEGVNSLITFTSNTGDYNFYTNVGTYQITPKIEQPNYFNISPAAATINFLLLNNSTQTQNFCITPNGFYPDLEIVITPIGAARPGFDTNYKIVFKNKGNQLLNGIVNLIFDDVRTDFVSSVPAVDNQLTGSLTWNFSNLFPFETRTIDLVLNLNTPSENPPLNSGDILHFTANTSSSIGEGTVLDNTFELNQTVVNAYDPNDKTCLEGNTITPEDIGKYVHYNINFENVGTADAVNVVIKDIIDTTMFDMNSLQLLYASHPVETKIAGNKVEFIFKNINLPPSIIDPIGGHGNVLFKIKTLPTLLVGDQIANIANIYFDYNAPIETNEARSTFAVLNNSNFVKDQSIAVAPNPANNNVTVTAKSNIKSIQLYDVQGRILQTVLENSKTATLDISNKANGVYFLKITTEIGSIVEKIIKE